jgi:hypothetical protein
MDMRDAHARGKLRGDERHLGEQRLEIVGDRRIAFRRLGVAAAEPAHLGAIGDMRVERERRRRREFAEPSLVARRIDARAEMRRRRIGGVAGNPQIVFFDEIGTHVRTLLLSCSSAIRRIVAGVLLTRRSLVLRAHLRH